MTSIPSADEIVWGKQGGERDRCKEQQAAWFGAFRSQLQEFSYEITDIEGDVPQGLRESTLFRNGPSRFERGDQRVKHYLDGDGYLSRIAFAADGRVFFTSKFVKTDEYTREDKSDRFLFRTTFGTSKPGGFWANAFETYLKNPANTHAIAWGDKLLALYEAGLPYQINPLSLDTLGPVDLNGISVRGLLPNTRFEGLMRLVGGQESVTAHPRIDPVRDRLVIWDWKVKAQPGRSTILQIDIREYDRNWMLQELTHHEMVGATVNPHDFAVTPSYYVFFENRLSFNVLPFLLGLRSPADCLKPLAGCPNRIHLVPRPDGPRAEEDAVVLDTNEWFSIHQAFACDRSDGGVDIYSAGWPASGLAGGFLTSWGGYAPDFEAIAPTFLWQTSVQFKGDSVGEQAASVAHRVVPGMEGVCIDHPCINPEYDTRSARYLYMTYSNQLGESSPPVGYLKLDLSSRERQIWLADLQCFVEEPVFVPKREAKGEDDGWLLGMMYDHQRERSCLGVFDTTHLDRGPVCRLWLTHHLVHGLHGSWIPEYCGP